MSHTKVLTKFNVADMWKTWDYHIDTAVCPIALSFKVVLDSIFPIQTYLCYRWSSKYLQKPRNLFSNCHSSVEQVNPCYTYMKALVSHVYEWLLLYIRDKQ